MRGSLIFPFLAELYRLDTRTTAEVDPEGPLSSGFDPDFKESVVVGNFPLRHEHPPLRLPCQVEPELLEALRLTVSGNAPRSRLELLFHFKDLEREGLVDPISGEALLRPGDRLAALHDKTGALVQTIRTPPGLYAIEVRPLGFGLGRQRPRRNVLLVLFSDRSMAGSI
ncbi:MAG: hypothetical protein A2284_18450 [Deltaproteobacteria bacterium RIFOXYA12_FULL_61_11]|nr:MAG: hypothetical protein A2284_18450 [Deltaproteobacteria bacterium RIFOXYA12_FULL_61_11]